MIFSLYRKHRFDIFILKIKYFTREYIRNNFISFIIIIIVIINYIISVTLFKHKQEERWNNFFITWCQLFPKQVNFKYEFLNYYTICELYHDIT